MKFRPALISVTLILLLAAVLGARGLNADTYWYDEWWSILFAGGLPDSGFSPAETFIKVMEGDPFHPPLFYVLLGTWGGIVGWSEPAARALSWLASLLGVAMIYRVGSALFSRKAGVYAALALGTCAFFLLYFHEVRMYSLLPFLCALGLLLYWRVAHVRWTRAGMIALFFALVAMLYTHYIAGALAVSIGIYHLIFAPKNRSWAVILAAIVGAGITFLPWVGAAGYTAALISLGDAPRAAITFSPSEVISGLLYLFSNGSIALLAVLAWYSLQQRRAAIRLVWVSGLVTVTLTILLNERLHFYINTRYLMAAFPLLALVVGAGAARLKLAPLMMSIWVVAGMWLSLNPAYFDSAWVTVLPWDRLVEEVRADAHSDDPLVFLTPDGTPGWINDPVARYYLHGIPVDLHLLESLSEKTPDQYDTDFVSFVDGAPFFRIAFDPQHRHSVFAESALQRFVSGRYLACQPARLLPDLTLQSYATAAEIPFDYQFGDGIALGIIQPLPAVVEGGLRLPLRATVDPAVPRGEYSVALHVETSDGTLVAQTDFALPDGCAIATIGTLPPGNYRALFMVYRWQTGERLPATNAATGETGDHLPVGEFTVTG